MPDFDSSVRDGAPTESRPPLRTAEDVIDHAQRLIDAPQPYDGYPLGWHFEAMNVGDLTAIAITALRESGSGPASDTP